MHERRGVGLRSSVHVSDEKNYIISTSDAEPSMNFKKYF